MSTRLYGSHTTWLKRVKNEERERTYNCQHKKEKLPHYPPLRPSSFEGFEAPSSKGHGIQPLSG